MKKGSLQDVQAPWLLTPWFEVSMSACLYTNNTKPE